MMKDKSFLSHDVLRIDLKDNPEQILLLQQAYTEIYQPAFPLAEERRTLEYFKDRLINGAQPWREYVFIAAGQNLQKPEIARVDALGIGIYDTSSHTALMAYNAVREGRGGLGRIMVQERMKAFHEISQRENKTLRGVFVEANDPGKAVSDVMDPHKRLAAFQKWGAEIIPIDYTQPPLDPYSDKCGDLILMNYPTLEGNRPDPEDILVFLRAMYSAYGEVPPEQDPDFIRMKKQLFSPSFNQAANPGLQRPMPQANNNTRHFQMG